MARTAQASDFTVPVEDVGIFTFARRTMRDEIAIQVEYARIIDGVTPTEWLTIVGNWLSTLRVLIVRAPAGFDLDTLDPLDDGTYKKLGAVFDALKDKERSFRSGSELAGQGGGAAAS